MKLALTTQCRNATIVSLKCYLKFFSGCSKNAMFTALSKVDGLLFGSMAVVNIKIPINTVSTAIDLSQVIQNLNLFILVTFSN